MDALEAAIETGEYVRDDKGNIVHRSITEPLGELVTESIIGGDVVIDGESEVNGSWVDGEYARSKGIQVINTPNASSRAVAELALAHMFSLSRMLQLSNDQMRKDGADFGALKKKYSAGTQLAGKTLGIIGFGRIGQELAKMALGIGMKVVAVDPLISSATLKISIGSHEMSLELLW